MSEDDSVEEDKASVQQNDQPTDLAEAQNVQVDHEHI